MTTHDQLLKEARIAIRNVHADTSVSLSETLEAMLDIQSETESLIEALEEDLKA